MAVLWGNQILIGGAGADSLYGAGGDDTVEGGGGADRLFGDNGPNGAGPAAADQVILSSPTLHGDALYPVIVPLPGGAFRYTWDARGGGEVSRPYDVTATPTGPSGLAAPGTVNFTNEIRTTFLSGGAYVALETAMTGNLYAANGNLIAGPFTPNAGGLAGSHSHPVAVANADGGFTAVWATAAGGQYQAWAQRFAASGAATGPTFQASGLTFQSDGWFAVKPVGDGSFLVIYGRPSTAANTGTFARHFDANWAQIGSEFKLFDQIAGMHHSLKADLTDIRPLGGGGFAVVKGGYLRSFDAGHTATGPATALELAAPGAISQSLFLPNGNIVNAAKSHGASGQYETLSITLHDASGARLTGPLTVLDDPTQNISHYRLTELAGGGFALDWKQNDNGGGNGTTHVMRFDVWGNAIAKGDSALSVAGDDLIKGGWGNDTAHGGFGHDTLLGEGGQDRLLGGHGHDSLNGGAGTDTLRGEAGNDTLQGGTFADRLSGGTGNDRLLGGAGADTLQGGSGADRLQGGAGADRLTGGTGADVFVYTAASQAAAGGGETIAGFQTGVDTLDLSGIDAIAGGGNDAFVFIGASAFGQVAGQLRYAAGVLSGDRNGDGQADFAITLTGAPTLVIPDLLL
jgi:Ca2+-binding RTX toxin-like protein